MMEGYYGRARSEVFDAEGWYRTGDLVVVDGEGFYYFKGRLGDMIKTSGANVSPREVESVIRSVAGLDSYVIGVDDPKRGQRVAAAIVVPAGRPIDEDWLRQQLAAHLSAYKVPRQFLAVNEEDLPKTSSGKVDVRTLRLLFAEPE